MNPPKTARNEEMLRLFTDCDLSFAAIGRLYGVTRECVRQIIRRLEQQKESDTCTTTQPENN